MEFFLAEKRSMMQERNRIAVHREFGFLDALHEPSDQVASHWDSHDLILEFDGLYP